MQDPRKVTAKFWLFYRSGWVKLHLRGAHRFMRHSYGGPTEEGWSRHTEAWWIDPEQGAVVCKYQDDGADCDGRLTYNATVQCPLDRLAAREPLDIEDAPGKLPEWIAVNSGQRDYSAEAMGY